MLVTQESLKQKDSEKNHIPGESIFSICYASGLSPYNDAFLVYYRKSTKNPEVPVIYVQYVTCAEEILPS
jgi:hypothetical protein